MPLFLAPKVLLISTPFQLFMRSVLTYRTMARCIIMRTILSIRSVKRLNKNTTLLRDDVLVSFSFLNQDFIVGDELS